MVLQRFARGLLFLGVSLLVLIPNVSVKAAGGVAVPAQDWSFSGVFGTFDRGELQRGFHVYKEVCAGCHSLNYVAFRNLGDLGFNDEEIKVIAKEYEV
jgi:ubiquinol-cytochrome c reductase cytochrome c1 subunit